MTAHEYALFLLNRWEYSSQKLKLKLISKGYEAVEVTQALDRLKESGIVDDRVYGRARIRAWVYKGYSPQWMKMRLRVEGLSEAADEIQGVYDEVGTSVFSQIQKLVKKKCRGRLLELGRLEENRVVAYVVGKGHQVADVLKVISLMKSQDVNEESRYGIEPTEKISFD